MSIKSKIALLLCLGFLASLTMAGLFEPTTLLPYPRHVEWGLLSESFSSPVTILGGKENPRAYRALMEVLADSGITITDDTTHTNAILILGMEPGLNYVPESAGKVTGLPKEGYVLEVTSVKRTPVVLMAGVQEEGTFYAVQTFRQLLDKGKKARRVRIVDYPTFTKERGFGEFFYGPVWTHQDRMSMFKFMGETKLNFYMYSPKDDPYNRDKWREDYPQEFIDRLQKLHDYGKQNFVKVSFAMNPGLSMKYSDDSDFQVLMNKYDRVRGLGIHEFSLQIDDIGNAIIHEEDQKLFKNQGEAHAYLSNRVYHYLKSKDPNLGFSMCGKMYYIAIPDEYTYSLGSTLDPEIPCMWTGGDICDRDISLSKISSYSSGILRKPFFSDNYPVNDYCTTRLLMGPLTSRNKEIVTHLYEGFLENPMNQAEASKIALATIADWAWNPYDYDPERSWTNAIMLVAGKKGYAPLRLFCEQNRSSFLHPEESLELNRMIDAYFYESTNKNLIPLRRYVQHISTIESDLNQTIANKKLLDEIKPWSRKLDLYGKAMVLALEIQNPEKDTPIAEQWAKFNQLKGMLSQITAIPVDVAGGAPERLIYRTTVLGAGLGINRYLPQATYNKNTVSSLKQDAMFYVDYITDGDMNSYFKANRGLDENDYFQVTLNKTRPVNAINLYMNPTSNPNDYVQHGNLEYSTDLKNWTVLVPTHPSEIHWKSATAIPMRAIRIQSTGKQPYWTIVREFQVVCADAPAFITGNLGGINDASKSYINDGSVAVPFKSTGPVKAGDYLEMQLTPSAVTTSMITLLCDDKDYFTNAVIEISSDGKNWKSLGVINSPAVQFPLKKEIVQGLRIRSSVAQSRPVSIYEWSLADSKGMVY